MRARHRSQCLHLIALGLLVVLAGCDSATTAGPGTPPSTAPTSPGGKDDTFPTSSFGRLGDESVSHELAAELQEVLDTAADGTGLTATVISPQGTWSGATGSAARGRAMRPDAQMSIASITKTLVAAQVMQLVEVGELSLDDPVADHLPPELDFDTNGATIADLLSHRSGYPEGIDDPQWGNLADHPLHAWTIEEVLSRVEPERDPVGQAFEYRGTNYLLLSVIVEQVTGRPLAEALRDGVLRGGGYERLILQPDERPSAPLAMPFGGPTDALADLGGFLPTLSYATAAAGEGSMAADSASLARWFRSLCAGEVVSAASLEDMTDFETRPEYGLGLIDRRGEYGYGTGALGHTGSLPGYTTVALCFQEPAAVVVVLANGEHDVDTTAGRLFQAATP